MRGPVIWRIALLGSAAALAASAVGAGQAAPEQNRTETKHLAVITSASAPAAARGGRLDLYVDIEPKPKMHVYAPEQKDYIPVSFTLQEADSFRAGAVKFPRAEKYFFAPLKETQLVYSKPFRLARDITVARTVRGPEITIKGIVRYQACDDAICYLPQNVPVSWTIAIKR